MQVADMTNKASAAVLGAQQTRAVSMVEDAGFLMMLSSNLYSNQLLAAVREPLCNAWDAHIEAGKTNVPIKVTITKDNEFILQDFGLGIPDDKIEVIYGTYGGSTKRNDSKTTGGFGLGSKAPWAIVDSFRVTSCHEGIKTVYSMSRACLENNGKPGITPVVTNLPTTDTGLTVSFMLKEDQVEEVARYVTYIAMHGDMCVEFTWGDQTQRLTTIDMDTTPGSYNINYDQWWNRYMGDHEVFVRYGSVIYPILKTPATEKAVGMLEDFIGIIGVRRIVVQAAPDTLALTPSREALSSQTMTENGIVNLCVDLVGTMEKGILERVPAQVEQALQRIRQGKCHDLNSFSFGQCIPGFNYIEDSIVRKYLKSDLGRPLVEKYKQAFDQAERAGNKHYFPIGADQTKGSRALKRMHLKALKHHIYDREAARELYSRYCLAPVITALSNIQLNLDSLYVTGTRWYNFELVKYKKDLLSSITNESIFEQLRKGTAGNVIYLTSRVSNSIDSIKASPQYIKNRSYWVIRVKPNMKPEDKLPLVNALDKQGFTVVDLTLNHAWDPVVKERKRAAANKPAKPVVAKERSANVLISVNDYIKNGRWDKVINRSTATDMAEAPTLKFYVEWDAIGHGNQSLGNYFKLDWATQEDLNGGVVVTNGIERRMAVSRGAVPVNDYFIGQFVKLAKDPALVDYFTTKRKRSIREDWEISSQTIKLCNLMGIKLPGYDKMTHNQKMEDVWSIAYRFSDYLHQLEQEQDPDTNYFLDLTSIKLRKLPFIAKLVTLEEDRMLRDLTRNKSIFQWLTFHPERSAALKSLVLSALKSGTKS